jgi:hypothetical protein
LTQVLVRLSECKSQLLKPILRPHLQLRLEAGCVGTRGRPVGLHGRQNTVRVISLLDMLSLRAVSSTVHTTPGMNHIDLERRSSIVLATKPETCIMNLTL